MQLGQNIEVAVFQKIATTLLRYMDWDQRYDMEFSSRGCYFLIEGKKYEEVVKIIPMTTFS